MAGGVDEDGGAGGYAEGGVLTTHQRSGGSPTRGREGCPAEGATPRGGKGTGEGEEGVFLLFARWFSCSSFSVFLSAVTAP